MYRPVLNKRDRGGAVAAVIAVHAALLFALLHLSGRIDLADPQAALRVFDVREQLPPPLPPPEPIRKGPEQRKAAKSQSQGAASPKNIRSQATPVVAPKPRIELPRPRTIAVTQAPRDGAQPTQGASDVRGPGTGAGGTGTGTGSGGSGSGTGGGGDGGYIVPPHLLTPDLRGRDFPRAMLDSWPRGAQLFARIRVSATGTVAQCIVDRGTGSPGIDATICSMIQQRFRYSPARNRAGQPVAGWSGYRQVPPR